MKMKWHIVGIMREITSALALLCLLVCVTGYDDVCIHDLSQATVPKRIAIIGTGAGGSSAAHYLNQLLVKDGSFADIILFEKEARVGGRNHHKSYAGLDSQVEIGGSVYHLQNYNIRNFTRAANFTERKISEEGELGIWNGEEFVFQTSSWSPITIAKVLWRYGLSPMKVRNLAVDAKNRFLRIYEHMNGKRQDGLMPAFDRPRDIFEIMDLESLSRVSFEEHLRQLGEDISRTFLDEFATVVTKINYGQNTNISALAGFLCFIGSGNEIVSVREGIASVWENVVKETSAIVRTDTMVNKIRRIENEGASKYIVEYDGKADTFDVVVIATPLEFSGIDIEEGVLPVEARFQRKYQVTHVTLVEGELDPTYFGHREGDLLPDTIGSVDGKGIPWRSVSIKGRSKGGQHVYKIFSGEEMKEEHLEKMFSKRSDTFHYRWDAYPVLTPNDREAPPFRLHPGLYYVNGMENYASVIEGESIAGQNVAHLIYNDLMKAAASK
ncbi:prenylcysteine oxidase [Planoprotostelium fungivorum]|uniref:Prenylcysteine oxidase n=1 Tax=Planoprotostelium fungivorum TaxID=1890364 RepID=A0A2P6NS77_9EUKA|nr:prenylcysteine oxidase [Planoprotostelium fungivorum]